MGDFFLIIDVLVAACGAYALSQWWKLKQAGKLVDCKLIYPSGCSADNCRDPEGFYAYVLPRFLFFGVAALLTGVLTVANDFLAFLPGWGSSTLNAGFMAVIVYFGAVISRSYKRFFE